MCLIHLPRHLETQLLATETGLVMSLSFMDLICPLAIHWGGAIKLLEH